MLSCLQFQRLTKSVCEPGVCVSLNNNTIALFINFAHHNFSVAAELVTRTSKRNHLLRNTMTKAILDPNSTADYFKTPKAIPS